MKFYYVYVPQSRMKKFQYIGYSEDLKKRYKTHNQGGVKSTKPYIPLELIHYEAYRNMKDAKDVRSISKQVVVARQSTQR